jgi:hypothetical protein
MKKIIKACIIFCSVSFVFGCSNYESIPAVVEVEGARITLFIPDAEEVRVYSTATADENRIGRRCPVRAAFTPMSSS